MKFINKLSFQKAFAILLLITVFLFFTNSPIAQETDSALLIATDGGKTFESQLEELLTTLYCPCGCVRETNKACVCATAQMLETEFRNRLLKGETVNEIRTEYLEKYGPQFSAVMKAEGVNLIAYLMPAAILIVTGGLIMFVLHQSRRNKMPLIQSDNQISDELQQQVEAELEKYKEQN